jgi:hypothetical protein
MKRLLQISVVFTLVGECKKVGEMRNCLPRNQTDARLFLTKTILWIVYQLIHLPRFFPLSRCWSRANERQSDARQTFSSRLSSIWLVVLGGHSGIQAIPRSSNWRSCSAKRTRVINHTRINCCNKLRFDIVADSISQSRGHLLTVGEVVNKRRKRKWDSPRLSRKSL